MNKYVVVSAAMAVVFSYQNCSPFMGARYGNDKQDVVKRMVFAPEYDTGSETEVPDDFPVTPQNTDKTLDIPVHYYCSNNWGSEIQEGRTIINIDSIKVALVEGVSDSSDGRIVCEVSGKALRDKVVSEKKLSLDVESCPDLKSGRYTLMVQEGSQILNTDRSVNIKRRSILIGNGNHDRAQPFEIDLKVGPDGEVSYTQVGAEKQKEDVRIQHRLGAFILWMDHESGDRDDLSFQQKKELCEVTNSPLVVQITQRPRKIRLIDPLMGILFDIMGINDTPAHSKRQISWFSARDAAEHYWITLPDAYGRVNGIDQLFGNNTVGPDGRTASDGYAALAKWDRNNDGQITAEDPVYRSLRFWADRNTNGIAEPVELTDAVWLGIVRIDLQYDPHYSETDKWGNEIKMKSVVEMYDGKLNLMYDIWFRKVD
jgi:hypothetical protein